MSSFLPSFNIPPNQRGIYVLRPRPVAGCANTGAVNRISDAAFDAIWPGGIIEFDEYAIGTPNPTFTPAQYGAVGAFQPHVATGSYFLNQAFLAPGQMTGTIATPLALNFDDLGVFVANDTSRLPSSTRCLSGTPFFNGSTAYFFTESDFTTPKPVVGVSLNVGFLNAVGTVRVRAYDSSANLLGTWFNETSGIVSGNFPEGFENFNLNRDSNVPIIAAVTVENLGDVAGLATSLIRFSNDCA